MSAAPVITAVIKTFERPERLVRLHESIRRFYPQLPVIIVDDSRQPFTREWDAYTTYLYTEYDIGLSEGRNRAVEQVTTPYTLILDDDFVFTARTVLEKFQHLLETTPFQLVAGRVLDEGRNSIVFRGVMSVRDDILYMDNYHQGPLLAGYPRYDYVLNFFLARTELLRTHRWDSALKIREHEEFFWRLKQADVPLTELPSVSIAHYPTESAEAASPEYQRKRFERLQTFHALACEKIGVRDFRSLGSRYYGWGIRYNLIFLTHYFEQNKGTSWWARLGYHSFILLRRLKAKFRRMAS